MKVQKFSQQAFGLLYGCFIDDDDDESSPFPIDFAQLLVVLTTVLRYRVHCD